MGAVEGERSPSHMCLANCSSLFESAESFGRRFERETDHRRFVGLVAGTESEPRPTAREHVEGGDDLHQQGGWADRGPGDHGAEVYAIGGGGEETKRGVGLEHRFVDRCVRIHLQQVVGDPHCVEAGVVDSTRQVDQVIRRLSRFVGPREVRDRDAELHSGVSANTGWRGASAAIASSDESLVTSKSRRTNRSDGIERYWRSTATASLGSEFQREVGDALPPAVKFERSGGVDVAHPCTVPNGETTQTWP